MFEYTVYDNAVNVNNHPEDHDNDYDYDYGDNDNSEHYVQEADDGNGHINKH